MPPQQTLDDTSVGRTLKVQPVLRLLDKDDNPVVGFHVHGMYDHVICMISQRSHVHKNP